MQEMTALARSGGYASEWKRTEPDFTVYLPDQALGPDGYNDHLHLEERPDAAAQRAPRLSGQEQS